MSNWENMELGEAIDFNPPEKLKKGEIAKKITMDKLVALEKRVSGYEIASYSGGTKFRNRDTLLAKITPSLENGKTAQVNFLAEDEVAFGSTEFIVLRANEHTIDDFVFYLAKSPTFRKKAISCMEGTSGRKRVNDNALKSQILPIPDFPTQEKIAAVLSALDSIIELNQRINAELESMAKTLYDYWFIQFDFPNEKGKPYKSTGGKMIWNDELKRDIPTRWEVGQLSDISNITMGQSPPGYTYNQNGEGMIFFQGSTDFGKRSPSIRQFTTKPSRSARKGDILLSVRAPVGTMNIAQEDCCIGRGLAALNSKENSITYLYEVMRNFKQIFDRRNVNGTTFGSITKDDLFSLRVLKPEKKVLEQFQKIIHPTFDLQNNLELESKVLIEMRDWLLPMLMNGQVKVS